MSLSLPEDAVDGEAEIIDVFRQFQAAPHLGRESGQEEPTAVRGPATIDDQPVACLLLVLPITDHEVNEELVGQDIGATNAQAKALAAFVARRQSIVDERKTAASPTG